MHDLLQKILFLNAPLSSSLPLNLFLSKGVEQCLHSRSAVFFGDEAIAASSHSGGYPINHLDMDGFNWPPLSIPAEKPICSSPEAVSLAGPSEVFQSAFQTSLPSSALAGTFGHSDPSLWSLVVGVGQPVVLSAAVQRSFPHPLRSASFSAPSCERTDLSAFVAFGVGPPVICA